MSEMTALEYFKAKNRMTNNCGIRCALCPLYTMDKYLTCTEIEYKNCEKAIEAVEEWAKENPLKTYKDVFFEKFPNAPRNNGDGYPLIDVRYVFGGTLVNCGEFKKTWDEEHKEPRP